MPCRNLVSSTIAALDELSRLSDAQRLLTICVEQFDSRDEETLNRVELLIEVYRSRMSLHLDELQAHLNSIRRTIGPTPPNE